MPRQAAARGQVRKIVEEAVAAEGLSVLGWRDVPVDNSSLGERVNAVEPVMQQIFIGRPADCASEDDFERRLFVARKVVSNRVYGIGSREILEYYPVSMSARTIVYKGMVLVRQLAPYYRDLLDPRYETALALVHQRFATNTFPSWRLAHPYRIVADNGEINTLRGNVNWMAARQASVGSDLFAADISKLWPISYEGQSDTACFDNALEFLVQGGYSLSHAMMTLIPEAWAGNPLMDEERRAFYEYHAALMEPWDGPAAVAFTDGRQIGATLDRNGLRPARYFVTDDDLVVLASEMGVLPVPEESIIAKWRLQPGKMLLVDLEQHRIVSDAEIKQTLSRARPYSAWLREGQIVLEDLNPVEPRALRTDVSLLDRQQALSYTQEDLAILLSPMATRRSVQPFHKKPHSVDAGEDQPIVGSQAGDGLIERLGIGSGHDFDRGNHDDFRSELLQRFGQLSRLPVIASHHDPLPEQRQLFKPVEAIAQRDHFADHNGRGWSQALFRDQSRQGLKRADQRFLIRARRPTHGHRGRGWGAAVRDELFRNRRDIHDSHEQNQGLSRPDLGPVDGIHAMPRDESHGGGVLAMRERDAGIGREAQRRGHAGHDLEGNRRFGERFDLLAATPENKWVAALQAHHSPAAARALHQHGADFFLGKLVLGALLTDVHALGLRGRVV